MNDDDKKQYFDALACRWDELCPAARVVPGLERDLARLPLATAAHIVDLGCGTGNLTACLLTMLGRDSKITAVDFAAAMVAVARRKIIDSRVDFAVAAADQLPLADGSVDLVLCFSAWPHFSAPTRVAAELWRVMSPGATACVWHAESRHTIDAIHRQAGEPVCHDMLEPAPALAERFVKQHFELVDTRDDEQQYWIQIRKPVQP